MPKQKTRSAAKKRFKLKKSGVIKRGTQNRRHNTGKRPNSFSLKSKRSAYVSDSDAKTIRSMIINN